ncbi:hypothetical protein, partial [Skermanella aerolata]|uniref:hypothetical protein n=1 Tax=Skermanella aerolata TaxID=393310 RepID=UPI001B3BCB3D
MATIRPACCRNWCCSRSTHHSRRDGTVDESGRVAEQLSVAFSIRGAQRGADRIVTVEVNGFPEGARSQPG